MNLLRDSILASFVLITAAAAQETPTAAEPVVAPATKAEVREAIRVVLESPSARLLGEVYRDKAPAGGGGMGMTIVVGGAGTETDPFEGAVEVFRKDGQTVIVSEDLLPGVVIFDDGNSRITRTTTGSDAVDASTLARDLCDLVRPERVLREVEHAEWTIRSHGEGGAIRAIATLRPRVLSARGSTGGMAAMMGFMNKQVEQVEVQATLDAAKKLTGIKFEVVRFDPQSVMQRQAMESAMSGGGFEGGTQHINPADMDLEKDKQDEDLERDVYVLKVSDAAVSERAKRLFVELGKISKRDGF